jgi:hypothetical protein
MEVLYQFIPSCILLRSYGTWPMKINRYRWFTYE